MDPNNKSLKEMSLEELWQLFPISLVPYNPAWEVWAAEEIVFLQDLLRDFNPVINHIGSTAISGIMAKPILDILVEISDTDNRDSIISILESSGYILMSRDSGRMSFNKGYTIHGYADKVFHIHFHVQGDHDEVLFRDFLKENPSAAAEYEDLKLSLITRFRHDRDGYTNAKSDFIRSILKKSENDNTLSSSNMVLIKKPSGKIGKE